MYKIKRTNYKFDLFSPLEDFDAYDYYEPPEFTCNKYGQCTLIPKAPKIYMEKVKNVSEVIEAGGNQNSGKLLKLF